MTIPADFKLLATPNIQIADTGATVHNTPYDIGLTYKRISTENNSVIVGNGQKVKSTSMGQIRGAVTTRSSQKVADVLLKEVVYTLVKI